MKRRVIIPAAGEAVRFGGVPKEMLPISEEETLLGRAVRMARRIGEPVIITNRKKEHLHRRLAPDVEIVVKEDPKHLDLWGSILLGLKHGGPGGLILPDTVMDFDSSTIPADMPIGFGTFQTDTPERFSCLTQGRIATKEFGAAVPAVAWGVVVWSGLVSGAFLGGSFAAYDPVFQMVMRTMGYGTFPLHYYHDLGTFAAYREFITGEEIKPYSGVRPTNNHQKFMQRILDDVCAGTGLQQIITPRFEFVSGGFDMARGELVCVKRKKYGEVRLCFAEGWNVPFARIRLHDKDLAVEADAVFEDACRLGDEIVRRWNAAKM